MKRVNILGLLSLMAIILCGCTKTSTNNNNNNITGTMNATVSGTIIPSYSFVGGGVEGTPYGPYIMVNGTGSAPAYGIIEIFIPADTSFSIATDTGTYIDLTASYGTLAKGWQYQSTSGGIVKITKATNKYLQGTFSITAQDTGNANHFVNITNGTFITNYR